MLTVMDLEKKRNKKKGIDFEIDNNKFKLNNFVKFKTGTVDDKFFPGTVYLQLSFWFDLNKQNIDEDFETEISFNRYFRRKLNEIYTKNISPKIKNNKLFPIYENNIYSFDVPHNVVYSKKKCFCSIELTLHTSNLIIKNEEFFCDIKSNIFKNIIDLSKAFSESDFFHTNRYYNIHNRK